MTTVQTVIRKRLHIHLGRWLVLLVASTVLGVGLVGPAFATGTATAKGGPPIGRILFCYSYASTSYPINVQDVVLKDKTTYLIGYSKNGHSLSGPISKGTYVRHGSKLNFLTGPYAKIHWYGIWKAKRVYPGGGTPALLALYTPKGDESLDCGLN